MQILVNNEVFFSETPLTLAELMAKLSLSEATGIALALNNSVITRSKWQEYQLLENDRITIIKASAGG